MSREQFMWGLSNGVIVLAVSAGFWMGLALWTLGQSTLLFGAAPVLLLVGLLIWLGFRVRRLAPGFSRASLRAAPKGSSIHRIGVAFNLVGIVQALSVGFVSFICWKLQRFDLIWPLIGLVISFHFLPLGRIFSIRPYYVLGVMGAAVALVSIFGLNGSGRTVAVGSGLGVLIGGCASYMVANAMSLADQALQVRSLPAETL